ncbi:MAG: adenosylhomocysteinase [Candidatus Micrarchaeota archaeon]
MSKVKDPFLSKSGQIELAWAEKNMPVLKIIRARFEKEKPLKGLTVGIALHLEKKTGVLLKTLVAAGAKVYGSSCNPNTTDDSVAAALADYDPKNLQVFAWAGQTTKEYYWCIDQVLDANPDIVIDDGNDLTMRIHEKRPQALQKMIGGCEETTTGIVRLHAMQKEGKLKLPIMDVNDAHSKYLLDNQFGTAQSVADALIRGLNILLAGKTVVVYGYGWCGKGIASRMRGLGANVVVVEVEGTLGPHEPGQNRALCALYDGYKVLNHKEAAKIGDIFITATGNKHVLRKEHFELMKDGAIMCNSGHFDIEINLKDLKSMSSEVKTIKDNVEEYSLKSAKKLIVLSEGRLVNLSRPMGQGHPIEIMDGSFAVQALSVEYLAKNKGKLPPGVIKVPADLDGEVARLLLKTQGITLEKPTKEQLDYANEWKEGT